MISPEMVALIVMTHCQSPRSASANETTVIMCPAPQVPVPAVPPWWRPGITHEPESYKMDPVKAVPKYSYKKKQKKKKKRKGKK